MYGPKQRMISAQRIASVLMLPLLTTQLAADDEGTQHRRQASQADRGAESPMELTRNYLKALVEGDEKLIASCFDHSTKRGSAMAEVHKIIARAVASARTLKHSAREKFGEEGSQVLREELDFKDSSLKADISEGWESILKEVEIFRNENGEKAVARVPAAKQEFWLMKRRGDRWYLATSRKEVAGMALGSIVFSRMEKVYDEAQRILRESETPDELREKLQKMDGFDKPMSSTQ